MSEWSCLLCTYVNSSRVLVCEICLSIKPEAPEATETESSEDDVPLCVVAVASTVSPKPITSKIVSSIPRPNEDSVSQRRSAERPALPKNRKKTESVVQRKKKRKSNEKNKDNAGEHSSDNVENEVKGEYRGRVIGVLQNLIGNNAIAQKIEEALFGLWKLDNDRYKQQVRTVALNLKDTQNPELKSRILSGELTPEVLSAAGPEELATQSLKATREALAAKTLRDSTRENTITMLIQQKVSETRNRNVSLSLLESPSESSCQALQQNVRASFEVEHQKKEELFREQMLQKEPEVQEQQDKRLQPVGEVSHRPSKEVECKQGVDSEHESEEEDGREAEEKEGGEEARDDEVEVIEKQRGEQFDDDEVEVIEKGQSNKELGAVKLLEQFVQGEMGENGGLYLVDSFDEKEGGEEVEEYPESETVQEQENVSVDLEGKSSVSHVRASVSSVPHFSSTYSFWVCSICTFAENPNLFFFCDICKTQRQ